MNPSPDFSSPLPLAAKGPGHQDALQVYSPAGARGISVPCHQAEAEALLPSSLEREDVCVHAERSRGLHINSGDALEIRVAAAIEIGNSR